MPQQPEADSHLPPVAMVPPPLFALLLEQLVPWVSSYIVVFVSKSCVKRNMGCWRQVTGRENPASGIPDGENGHGASDCC